MHWQHADVAAPSAFDGDGMIFSVAPRCAKANGCERKRELTANEREGRELSSGFCGCREDSSLTRARLRGFGIVSRRVERVFESEMMASGRKLAANKSE